MTSGVLSLTVGIFDVGRVGPERGRSGRCPPSGQPLARAALSYLTVKLTDTQLVILPAASQRQTTASSFPPSSRAAAHKVVSPAPRRGALEDVPAGDALPILRRHDHEGPIALRVTPAGLSASPPAGDPGQLVAASPKSAAPSRRSGRKPKQQKPRARFRQYPGDLCLGAASAPRSEPRRGRWRRKRAPVARRRRIGTRRAPHAMQIARAAARSGVPRRPRARRPPGARATADPDPRRPTRRTVHRTTRPRATGGFQIHRG
jgi:hypothetical protein